MANPKILSGNSAAFDTYENVVIGHFLISVGVRMGLDNHDGNVPWVCSNLLQQTPLDTRLGDVLVFNSSFFRVIEFKRASNDAAKEHQKLESLSVALGVPKLKPLTDVSRRIHWYVQSDTRSGSLQTWVVPYLDFGTLDADGDLHCMDLAAFVEDTARQASNRQMLSNDDVEQCRRYLDVVYHSYASRAGTSGSSGALIFQATAGGLQNLVLPDLLEVLRTPREIFERAASLSLTHELSPRHEIAHRHEISPKHEISPRHELYKGISR